MWRCVAFAAFACLALGCTPRVRVVKDPGPHNHGIRYYRPKPYLLIVPAGTREIVETEEQKITKLPPSDEYVSIQLEYLPDFSEEYAIAVRPGLGSATVNFKLDNGWNLTEISQELDSQFDENVSAIADLVGAAGNIRPTGEGRSTPQNIEKRWVVRATNVPIGYYEAVINRDPHCSKRLYGWRYVGFAPFNSCPTDMVGGMVAGCEDRGGPIYGLVFERGAMTFKPLVLAESADLNRVLEPTGKVTFGSSPGEPAAAGNIQERIQGFVESQLMDVNVRPLQVTRVIVDYEASSQTALITLQARSDDDQARMNAGNLIATNVKASFPEEVKAVMIHHEKVSDAALDILPAP